MGPRQSTGKVSEEKLRYLRRTATAVTPECTFTLRRDDKGWTVKSRTGQGDVSLIVSAEYDARDHLIKAEVIQAAKENRVARVQVSGGSARVLAAGKVQEVEVPPGVIVTSAPDWTDVFLLCKRYDRKTGGKQELPGLWIHPEKGAFALTFTIERIAAETVKHRDKQLKLDRFVIRLRNKSEYTAWADAQGRLIRLQPGTQGKAGYELVLEGHEK